MIQYKKTALAITVESSLGVDFSLKRAYPNDAGVDLRCCSLEKVELFPGTITKVHTGVHVWVGSSGSNAHELFRHVGLTVPRSSCPGVILRNTIGVIDDPYQGEIMLNWFNPLDQVIVFNPGEKIAQFLVVPVYIGGFEQVQEFSEGTPRGEKGLGSSGKM